MSRGRIVGEYFEGSLCRVKTARTPEKQTRFLPPIVPVYGLVGLPWFHMFIEARDYLDLDAIPEEPPETTNDVIVVFPSCASHMCGALEKMGSAEMTERLGECLAKILRTTSFGLTYTNIFGLTLEENELLGSRDMHLP